MRDKIKHSFNKFLTLPSYTNQKSNDPPNNVIFRYRPIRTTLLGQPDDEDLEKITYLSHSEPKIRKANPHLIPDLRRNLYTSWFKSNPNTFLLLERIPPDNKGVSIIGNTIILPLSKKIFWKLYNKEIAVIDLREEDICPLNQAFEVLLFDTWVLHSDHQDYPSRKKHFSYGYGLVLKHISMFWYPSKNQSLTMYAEPDSEALCELLKCLSFKEIASTKIGELLFEIQYPPNTPVNIDNATQRKYLDEVVKNIEECKSW